MGQACLIVTMVTKVTVNSGLMSLAPTNEESAWHGEENLGEEKSNLQVGVALCVLIVFDY